MSVRYVCAQGCGSFAYSRHTYRCAVCGLRIRFLEATGTETLEDPE